MVKKAGCGGSFDGLCCRMVIETKRVFDGCAFTTENITLTLTTDNPIPQSDFVSARILSSELCDCVITTAENGCSRVSGIVTTRFAVTYSYGGELYTVVAVYREQKDALLRLPHAALVPYKIEIDAVMNVASGAVIAQNTVTVSGCLLQIIKVTAPVDVLVPTYGYCKYPPCTGCPCACVENFGDNIFPSFDSDNS